MSEVYTNQVCKAYAYTSRRDQPTQTAIEYLVAWTGMHAANCLLAIEVAATEGYVELLPAPENVEDVSYGRLTTKGLASLTDKDLTDFIKFQSMQSQMNEDNASQI